MRHFVLKSSYIHVMNNAGYYVVHGILLRETQIKYSKNTTMNRQAYWLSSLAYFLNTIGYFSPT